MIVNCICKNNVPLDFKFMKLGVIGMLFVFICVMTGCELFHRNEDILKIDISTPSGVKQLCFSNDDIDTVGINKKAPTTGIEIRIKKKYHQMLKGITKENIGRRIVIKINDEVLSTGSIRVPMENGFIGLPLSIVKSERIINSMSRKPDYYLEYKAKEIEEAKIYTVSAKNPWAEKALYALTEKNFDEAENYAKKAIESEPNTPQHYMFLSTIYYTEGKLEFALAQLLLAEKLIEQSDIAKYPGLFFSLADIYLKQGKDDNAINSLNKLLELDNDNLNGHLELAKIYEKNGQIELAIEEYHFLSEYEDDYFRQKGLDGINRLGKEGGHP